MDTKTLRKEDKINFSNCKLYPLTQETAELISTWKYKKPYDVYSFAGSSNGYLMNAETWGVEQFCLMLEDEIIGQVACQFEGDVLWVGWSLCPYYCSNGKGSKFIEKSVSELRRVKKHFCLIKLKVVAWNERAIKAYQKAGFVHVETVQDEIAYSDNVEDFWVMELK